MLTWEASSPDWESIVSFGILASCLIKCWIMAGWCNGFDGNQRSGNWCVKRGPFGWFRPARIGWKTSASIVLPAPGTRIASRKAGWKKEDSGKGNQEDGRLHREKESYLLNFWNQFELNDALGIGVSHLYILETQPSNHEANGSRFRQAKSQWVSNFPPTIGQKAPISTLPCQSLRHFAHLRDVWKVENGKDLAVVTHSRPRQGAASPEMRIPALAPFLLQKPVTRFAALWIRGRLRRIKVPGNWRILCQVANTHFRRPTSVTGVGP